MTTLDTGEFPLRGQRDVPDDLTAYAQPTRTDSDFATDRHGRPKVTKIHLRSTSARQPDRPRDLVTDTEWTWLTQTSRRWTSIVTKLGTLARAQQVCHQLAASSCGALEHRYQAGAIQQPPTRWIPASQLRSAHHTKTQQRHHTRQRLQSEAETLNNQLLDQWPGAAASLTTSKHESLLRWLVAAAQDLADGRSHDGVRAFVQHHNPANDKARDDLSTLLKDTGWEPDALRALGVDRNPYIGLGGPIQAHLGERTLDFTGWPGPADIRLPAHSTIRLACAPGTQTLAIIENRQAAETISDLYPDTAIIWCRGQHPDTVTDLIAQTAHAVSQVLICTDADLGGVRIAARIHDHLTPDITPTLIDVGVVDHPQGKPFTATTLQHIKTYSQRSDAIGQLATAVAHRGYPVVQEAPIRRALQDHLGETPTAPVTVVQPEQIHELQRGPE